MNRALLALRWPLAAGVILSAHLAMANWLLTTWQAGGVIPAPEPIYVDLEPAPEPAPAPEAAEEPAPAEEPEPAPAPKPAPTPEPIEEPAPAPEPVQTAAPSFTPPPLTELPPLADTGDLFAPIISTLALAQSDRPQTRPDPKPRRETPAATPRKQPEPRRQAEPTTRKTAQPSEQPSAPAATPQRRQQAAPAGPGPREIANWHAQVSARIVRHMMKTRLPGRAQIIVQLAVTIGPNGAASARLASSTGDARMDQALTRQVARMPRMPAPPGGRSEPFVLPVRITN